MKRRICMTLLLLIMRRRGLQLILTGIIDEMISHELRVIVHYLSTKNMAGTPLHSRASRIFYRPRLQECEEAGDGGKVGELDIDDSAPDSRPHLVTRLKSLALYPSVKSMALTTVRMSSNQHDFELSRNRHCLPSPCLFADFISPHA